MCLGKVKTERSLEYNMFKYLCRKEVLNVREISGLLDRGRTRITG